PNRWNTGGIIAGNRDYMLATNINAGLFNSSGSTAVLAQLRGDGLRFNNRNAESSFNYSFNWAAGSVDLNWGYWTAGSYSIFDSNEIPPNSVAGDSMLLYMAASVITPATATTPTGTLSYHYVPAAQQNRAYDAVDGAISNYDGSRIIVDFDDELVAVDIRIDFLDADTFESTGILGSFFGTSGLTALYSAQQIDLVGDGYFAGGNGALWGQFIGSEHEGIMAQFRGTNSGGDWFHDVLVFEQMSITNGVDEVSLADLGGDPGIAWFSNADSLYRINGDALRLLLTTPGTEPTLGLRSAWDGVTYIGGNALNYSDNYALPGSAGPDTPQIHWGYWEAEDYTVQTADPSGFAAQNK
ncbi:hypothetical protein C9988_04390, partial [Pseudidiomarina aestuarii]